MGWYLLEQEEKQGEEVKMVKCKRLKGGSSKKKVDGKMVVKGFRIPNLMLKTLIAHDQDGLDFMLPREVVFSQMWVSKKDGTKFVAGVTKVRCPKTGKMKEVKSKPDKRFYFLRHKVTVKAVQIRWEKDEKVSKNCLSMVTRKVPVKQEDSGAMQDENGRWYIKHVISNDGFETNDKEYNNRWGLLAKYLIKEFGSVVAREYLTELIGILN